MKKRNSGFTIVELVIVIAIIGLLAAVLVPTFSSIIGSAKNSADVQTLTHINSMIAVGEIDNSNLKEYSLQNSDWELAYSLIANKVIIVDSDNKIVASWNQKMIGRLIDEYKDYIRISQLSDDGGGDNENNDDESEENEWESAKHVTYLADLDDGTDTELELYLEGSIKSIPSKRFFGWTNLTRIYIAGEVEEIGDNAFSGCTALTEVYFAGDVTEIGKSAFDGCTALTEVYFAGTVTTIGSNAFKECRALNKINLNGVVEIGNNAFNNCQALDSLELPSSLEYISQYTFRYCRFTTLSLPCAIIKSGNVSDGEVTVAKLSITGGTINPNLAIENGFSAWLGYLISASLKEGKLKTLTITNTVIGDANPFVDLIKNTPDDIVISIDQSSYESIKDSAVKNFFASYVK